MTIMMIMMMMPMIMMMMLMIMMMMVMTGFCRAENCKDSRAGCPETAGAFIDLNLGKNSQLIPWFFSRPFLSVMNMSLWDSKVSITTFIQFILDCKIYLPYIQQIIPFLCNSAFEFRMNSCRIYLLCPVNATWSAEKPKRLWKVTKSESPPKLLWFFLFFHESYIGQFLRVHKSYIQVSK